MIFPKKYWKAKLMKKNLNNVWDNHSISWRNGPPSQDINVCVNQFYSQWHSPLTLLWIRTEQFVIAGLRFKHCSWPLLGQLCKVKSDVREKFLWLSMKYENLLSITICVTLFKETYKIFLKCFTLSTCLYSKIKKCWYLHSTEPYRQKSLFTLFFFQLCFFIWGSCWIKVFSPVGTKHTVCKCTMGHPSLLRSAPEVEDR